MLKDSPEAKFLETHLEDMCADARANGFEVIVCEYNGLRVPVLKVIADKHSFVEGQELSSEQMMAATWEMASMAEGDGEK